MTTRTTKAYGGYLIKVRLFSGKVRWFAYKCHGPVNAVSKAEKRMDVDEILQVSHRLSETEWKNALANLAELDSNYTHNRAGRRVAE